MQITTTKKFDKQFKKQPLKIQLEFAHRIALFIDDIHNPILKTQKLSGKLKELWSFNVSGDIRVFLISPLVILLYWKRLDCIVSFMNRLLPYFAKIYLRF